MERVGKMKTTASTSALIEGTITGNFTRQQREIVRIFEYLKKPLSAIHILSNTNNTFFCKKPMAYSSVIGRCSELRDMGILSEEHVSGTTLYSLVTDPAEQARLKLERENHAFENWVKKGNDKGWFNRCNNL